MSNWSQQAPRNRFAYVTTNRECLAELGKLAEEFAHACDHLLTGIVDPALFIADFALQSLTGLVRQLFDIIQSNWRHGTSDLGKTSFCNVVLVRWKLFELVLPALCQPSVCINAILANCVISINLTQFLFTGFDCSFNGTQLIPKSSQFFGRSLQQSLLRLEVD